MLKIGQLLCGIIALCFIHNTEGFFDVVINLSKGGVRGKMTPEQCTSLDKAMIKRDEWSAVFPRQTIQMDGIARDIIVWQTGPDTCDIIGVRPSNCQQCLHNTDCVKQGLLAIQQNDLEDDLDDIKYNFLIDEQGTIYEGRGWDVVGEHTAGINANSVGIALIGDFTDTEPSEAAQDSLSQLILCGMRASKLLYSSKLNVAPGRVGRAFYEMTLRCQGLCI